MLFVPLEITYSTLTHFKTLAFCTKVHMTCYSEKHGFGFKCYALVKLFLYQTRLGEFLNARQKKSLYKIK